MKQAKLVNKTTGEEHISTKVVVDGFDYYVSDGKYKEGDILCCSLNGLIQKATVLHLAEQKGSGNLWGKVIATNNPNIDLPQVIDEVEELSFQYYNSNEYYKPSDSFHFSNGYKKSQETHPNSDPDMIEFGIWLLHNHELEDSYDDLLKLWKAEQIKTIQIK